MTWKSGVRARLLLVLLLAASAPIGCAAAQVGRSRVIVRPDSQVRELTEEGSRRDRTAGGRRDLVWPVDGPLSSPFGLRDGRPHDGIDIAVVEGTPVRAALDGVVAYAGARLRGYGNLVILRHPAEMVTVYAHNRELLVREGQTVAGGQVIARSGQTGHATAPHVHFEVRLNQRPQDPLEYLPPHLGDRPYGRSHSFSSNSHPRRARFSKTGNRLQGHYPAHRARPVAAHRPRPAQRAAGGVQPGTGRGH